MRPLLRPAEMAAADRLTIEGGVPAETLMERAGRAVATAAVELAGGRYGKRVLVLCGKGNNGGDGFVAARVLSGRGLGVTCVLTCDAGEIMGAAARHLHLLRSSGTEPLAFHDGINPDHYDVVVDAIFGTGFKDRADGVPARAIEAMQGHERVLAVDIPSGVDGLTGAVTGPAITAALTVAIAAEKTGTALPPGALHAGIVRVVDIGIDVNVRKMETAGEGIVVDSFVEMAEARDVARSLPVRRADAHKRSSGSVAILAGSEETRGAPQLTAQGALRMGAGYVTLGSTRAVKEAVSGALPEILSVQVSDGDVLDEGALKAFSHVLDRADALAVGPGLGVGRLQGELVHRVLASIECPVVLDADALNVLSEDTSALAGRRYPTVITPHPAEMARLLGVSTEEIVANRLEAAREAASRFPSVVVLLKGYRTLISYAGGRVVVVIPVGGSELATAGTGDVLTGAIAALLAQGAPPVGAAITGAYVHGLAGSVAGERVGRLGVIASDVADALPEAIELLMVR